MTSLPLSRLQKRLLVAIAAVLALYAARTGADTLAHVGARVHAVADAPHGHRWHGPDRRWPDGHGRHGHGPHRGDRHAQMRS